MGARPLDIAAAVAAVIPGAVRRYVTRIDAATLSGRLVAVFPVRAAYPGSVSRGEQIEDATIAVMIAERYTGTAAEIPDAWVDERIIWVAENVLPLVDPTTPQVLPGVYPDSAEWTTLYDAEQLEKNKLFCSVVTITFREER